MNSRIGAAFAVLGLWIAGCTHVPPQGSVSLAPEAVAKKETRIGVAMTPLAKPDMHIIGAGCLLCIAAANVANSALIDYSRTLPSEDLAGLKEEVAGRIRAKGGNAIILPDAIHLDKLPDFGDQPQPNFARKNFTGLRSQYGIDKLVVIEVNVLGMWRTYSAYIPTSDPKAAILGRGYMVDLATNAYEWYLPLTIMKASDKGWDEPPKFPGLTNAYFQVMELGKDAFLSSFN